MDAKKLKTISAELKKASAMHKGQAAKIDRMLKSMNKTTKKYNKWIVRIRTFFPEVAFSPRRVH